MQHPSDPRPPYRTAPEDSPHNSPSGPLGKRHVTTTDGQGRRWVAFQCGGAESVSGEAFLTLALALDALGEALRQLGIGPTSSGPRPVAVTLSDADFLRLRDALIVDGAPLAHFKSNPRHKRIDPSLCSFMMRGITVAAGDVEALDLTCPSRRHPATAPRAQG